MFTSRIKTYCKLFLCNSFSCNLGCLLLAISAQAVVVVDEEQLTCYSSKAGPENCRGDQCQPETCGSEHDACLVREISWESDQREPKVTYECATKAQGFSWGRIRCCKDYDRKDCRLYTQFSLSNKDKDFTGNNTGHGGWICPDQQTTTVTVRLFCLFIAKVC